ncbi:MAG: radical SAM family heme chaperone HemW [Desulfobulbus sp.]|jgi:oxygen-independent coproporphyrinogen-3 oxidase|uniref:radical SAM family heme chaperone HemW n=1 Tax=Desulfobulbus sp. TaxID=895 RepID=UPI002848EC94|nr:radical SAM family heme chaperone HemW [Desulfobulbus sp.]MDR2548730.1 radical SAM family heme chaperone HemW [Desulfobulbus sp.]
MERAASAGLYVHVPFCRQKCPYCSFHSFPPQPGDIARSLAATQAQMRLAATLPEVRALTFATVFFGGGTPSLLPAEALAGLLAEARRLFTFTIEEPEITVEVNPGTVDATGLAHLRRAGFNRLSVGVQSFNDTELRLLGRIHRGTEAREVIAAARRAGFANLSFDLMYGLPGQTVGDWQTTLDRAMTLAPVHLSMYELTVEEGTPFALAAGRGDWRLPNEDEVLTMMAAIDSAVGASDLTRYEISNYAATGRQCRHNLNYWHNGCYLGLGPGAVSGLDGERRLAMADLATFCRTVAAGSPGWCESERLDREAAFRETVVMGLRMTAGVQLAELEHRFSIDLVRYYGATLTRLVAQDLLVLRDGRLFLSARGLPLANRVMADMV